MQLQAIISVIPNKILQACIELNIADILNSRLKLGHVKLQK